MLPMDLYYFSLQILYSNKVEVWSAGNISECDFWGAFHSRKSPVYFDIMFGNSRHAQWNGTFRLQRPDPSHRAFDYCSCKQDTEERYWGEQSRKGIFRSERPKWHNRLKWTTNSGRTEPNWSVPFDFQPKFPGHWAESYQTDYKDSVPSPVSNSLAEWDRSRL